MIKEVEFEFRRQRQVFDVRDVLSKIEYLEAFFEGELEKYKYPLKIVIAIPYFSPTMRVIKDIHDGLFQRQHLKKAKYIADALNEKHNRINVVDIISDAEYTSEVVKKANKRIDYVIFLDVFTELERHYIGSEIASNTPYGRINKELHSIELFSVNYAQYLQDSASCLVS